MKWKVGDRLRIKHLPPVRDDLWGCVGHVTGIGGGIEIGGDFIWIVLAHRIYGLPSNYEWKFYADNSCLERLPIFPNHKCQQCQIPLPHADPNTTPVCLSCSVNNSLVD